MKPTSHSTLIRVAALAVAIYMYAGIAPQLHAQLIAGAAGDITRIDPPRVLRRTNIQDDKKVMIVEEQQGDFIDHDLALDISGSGKFTQFPRSETVLPTGTMVNCTLAFVSPAADDTAVYDFSLTFDRPLLGVIASGDLLEKSNQSLGNAETNYPNQIESQGLNLDGSSTTDSIEISPDRRTVTVHIVASGQLKVVRFIAGSGGIPNLSNLHEGTAPKFVNTNPVGPSRTNNRPRRRYRVAPTYTPPTYTVVE